MLSLSLQLQVASFTCHEYLEGVEFLKVQGWSMIVSADAIIAVRPEVTGVVVASLQASPTLSETRSVFCCA
eukprot:709392-Rhodomonas_salina.1